MKLDPDDPIVRTAVKGKIVEEFLTSDVGKLLTDRARVEIDKATDELKTVWPLRVFKVLTLQHKIEVWEGFQQTLAEVIMEGENAMKILEGDD